MNVQIWWIWSCVSAWTEAEKFYYTGLKTLQTLSRTFDVVTSAEVFFFNLPWSALNCYKAPQISVGKSWNAYTQGMCQLPSQPPSVRPSVSWWFGPVVSAQSSLYVRTWNLPAFVMYLMPLKGLYFSPYMSRRFTFSPERQKTHTHTSWCSVRKHKNKQQMEADSEQGAATEMFLDCSSVSPLYSRHTAKHLMFIKHKWQIKVHHRAEGTLTIIKGSFRPVDENTFCPLDNKAIHSGFSWSKHRW